MSAGESVITMMLGDRKIAVRRVALTPAEVASVVGERSDDILLRLKAGDLDAIRGSARWLVRVESAVAFAEAQVHAGLLEKDALNRLAALVERRETRLR
jgi:hypothetical protein